MIVWIEAIVPELIAFFNFSYCSYIASKEENEMETFGATVTNPSCSVWLDRWDGENELGCCRIRKLSCKCHVCLKCSLKQ